MADTQLVANLEGTLTDALEAYERDCVGVECRVRYDTSVGFVIFYADKECPYTGGIVVVWYLEVAEQHRRHGLCTLFLRALMRPGRRARILAIGNQTLDELLGRLGWAIHGADRVWPAGAGAIG